MKNFVVIVNEQLIDRKSEI